MPSAGVGQACFLCKDGQVVAYGCNATGGCNIPVLPEGLTYAQVAAGGTFALLLRSDGVALTCGGGNSLLQIPVNRRGVTYTQAAAGFSHWVLLRSDGTAVVGNDNNRTCRAYLGPVQYTQVAAGTAHTVLLTEDGVASARGQNDRGQCNILALPIGTRYAHIAAGYSATGLIRSDGIVVVCSTLPAFRDAQNLVPALEEGLTYVEMAIGYEHIVLLRSDGMAFAAGSNEFQQCAIPPLEDGVVYTQVAAMSFGTLLLRSDGTVASAGWRDHNFAPRPDRYDVANVTEPLVNLCVVPIPTRPQELILQLWVRAYRSAGYKAECRNLAGNVVIDQRITDFAAEVLTDIVAWFPTCCRLVVLLEDGRRLTPCANWWFFLQSADGCD